MWAKYNPFNPNGVVPDTLFAGRSDQSLFVLRKLTETSRGRSASYFLYGERGIGKTSLAKLITTVARKDNPKLFSLKFLTAYYAAVPSQNFRSVMESALNDLTDSMPESWLGAIEKRLGSLFKNGKFSIGAFGVEVAGESPERQQGVLRDEMVSILSNLLRTSKEAEEKKDGVLIVIDETQNISDIEAVAPTLRGILAALDFKNLGNVSFLLVGLDRAYEDFIEGDPSARRNFDPIKLDVMPTDEAQLALTKGFDEVGIKWSEDILKGGVLLTGGYPHSIQVLGHQLVDVDLDGKIDQADLNRATTKATAELRDKEFASMYNFKRKVAGPEKILNILALFGPLEKKVLAKHCKEAYSLANPYQYLSSLEKSGSIKNLSDGRIELHSALFRGAIRMGLIPEIDFESQLGKMWKNMLEEEKKS